MLIYKNWAFPNRDNHFKKSVSEYPETNYQQETLETAYEFLKNFNVAIDIGANVGLHTVRFSNKFDTVYSFEPVKDNFDCLKYNTKNNKNITIYNFGIGAIEEELAISIPTISDNCGAYSLIDFKNYQGELTKEKIKIITLDSLNLSPSLIKIDTQGFEKQVLIGSLETIKKSKPVLILECESKDQFTSISFILGEIGYKTVKKIRKDYIWAYQK
jgi:FkbM family methyltransferase